MADKTDVWMAVFAAAMNHYGEERAPQVADRAVTEFEKRFSKSEGSIKEMTEPLKQPAKSPEVVKP